MTQMIGSSNSEQHYSPARKRQRMTGGNEGSRFAQEDRFTPCQQKLAVSTEAAFALCSSRPDQAKATMEVTGAEEEQTAKRISNPQSCPSITQTENSFTPCQQKLAVSTEAAFALCSSRPDQAKRISNHREQISSTPGQAVAEKKASDVMGCAVCRHISAPSHAAAEWVAAEEMTQTVGNDACRPGQAAAKKEGDTTTGRRQAKAPEKEANAMPGRRQAKAVQKGARQTKGISEARARMLQENKNWGNLSQTAQSRHLKNDIRARVRSLIPGVGSVSENSLMLQAAARIKQLEMEIDSVASHLERFQKVQSSNGGEEPDNSLKDQNVPAASLGEGFEPRAFDRRADGPEILRAVLPLSTKARGTRLLDLAFQYMSELTEERNMMCKQVDEYSARSKESHSVDQQLKQNTAEAAHTIETISASQQRLNHQIVEAAVAVVGQPVPEES